MMDFWSVVQNDLKAEAAGGQPKKEGILGGKTCESRASVRPDRRTAEG